MEYMFMPLARYAQFSGRSRRKEYWLFTLFIILVYMVLLLMGGSLLGDTGSEGMGFATTLLFFFVLAIIIPSIAVQVRRLHDTDRSGWWTLVGFIPFVGGLILLYFMILDGTPGPNQYGEDPKGRANAFVEERSAGVRVR